MELADAIETSLRVCAVFSELGVDHLVGGSLASSLYGYPRSTNDVDLVADLHLAHVDRLVAALQGDFYVDADVVRDAVQRRATFNVIHLATMFKVVVFVLSDDPAQQREMERRKRYKLDDEEGHELELASAEDIVLMELDWYRLGQGVSERQWNDSVGVLKVQADRLDLDYLESSARQMGLQDLLLRALQEAGLKS